MAQPELNGRTIHLDAFDEIFPRNIGQGWRLHQLVARQGSWLAAELPGAARRYRTGMDAGRNVARLATAEGFKPYLVMEGQRHAIGIGTVCMTQTVRHPALPETLLQFHDHDYWLDEQLAGNKDAHTLVAKELWRRNGGQPILPEEGVARTQHPVVTIPVGASNPPRGYQELGFRPLTDEPVSLGVPPGGSDPYDVTRGGRPLNMYVHPEDFDMLQPYMQ